MKKVEQLFNYDDLSKEEVISAVKEVMNVLRNKGIEEETITELEHKFKIKQPKKYDLFTSPVCKYLNSKDISITAQGYITENVNTKDEIQFPIVSIVEDIRKLEAIMVDLNLNASK